MTLEETRAEIRRVRKKRRRLAWIFASIMVLSLAAGIYAIANILPLYGQWQYQNRREEHALCSLDGPAFLDILIKYQGGAPSGITIESSDGAVRLRDAKISDDPESKTMSICCDAPPDAAGRDYIISLVPADNYELQYSVTTEPSYKYIDGEILFYSDENGNLWLSAEASYGRCLDEQGLRLSVTLKGSSYAPVLYDGWIPCDSNHAADGKLEICLSETALWKKIDFDKGTRIEAVLSSSYLSPYEDAPKPANLKSSAALSEWPGYDEDQKFDLSDTNTYLAGLNLKPPEGREPLPGTDAYAAGQEQNTAQTPEGE